MRTKLVAANWKMNKSKAEVDEFIHQFPAEQAKHLNNVEILICPPYPYLSFLNELYSGKGIHIGAQNISAYEKGAYTGEVSASILKSLNIDYCIIGHSERRKYFHETDADLSAKVNQTLKYYIRPVFCCGELIEERNKGVHFEVVENQLKNAVFHLEPDLFSRLVIAYEPVWAIGTGLNATSEQAQEMHRFIRQTIEDQYNSEIAAKILILYGGSCNSQNAQELFACPDVDGGLVGGASLMADEFYKIIMAANG
jgi:triosephosphate isomerase (TIM)